MTTEDTDRDARQLAAAATVHSSREEVLRALGPLAARPLDEQAADQMRGALARAQSKRVRAAVQELEASAPPSPNRGRRHLSALPTITDPPGPAPGELADACATPGLSVLSGGAA